MCLHKLVQDKNEVSDYYKYKKKIGYKVLVVDNARLALKFRALDGDYWSRDYVELNKRYFSTNKIIPLEFDYGDYESGFHIYSSLRDARKMKGTFDEIVEVEYKKPVAIGIENRKTVIVAKEIVFKKNHKIKICA